MSLDLFNTIHEGAIEVIVDAESRPWIKQVDIGEYVGIKKMRDATLNVPSEDKKSRYEITAGLTDDSYSPPKGAKPHDGFLSVNGIASVVLHSRKPKARQVAAWLIKEIMPRGFNKVIEEKQQAVDAERHKVKERDTRIQAIQYDNVGLQGEIRAKDQVIDELIANRHVPRSGDIDTVLVTIEKNEPDEVGKAGQHPFYMLRCQKMQVNKRLRVLRVKYPEMEVLEPESDDANAVHAWNRFKRTILTKENYYRNHFTLPEDTVELFEDLFNVQV